MKATTIRLDRPVDLLSVGAEHGFFWTFDGLTLAGMGAVTRIPFARPGGFGSASDALAGLRGDDEVDRPGSGPVGFAALLFDREADGELLIPQVVVGSDRSGQRWATLLHDEGIDATEVGARVGALLDEAELAVSAGAGRRQPTRFEVVSALTPEFWRDEILTPARDLIAAGHLDKVVLARELSITCDQAIQMAPVLRRLTARFPAGHVFAIDGFIGASPEQLISRLGDVVRAHPLAGTAPRSSDPDRDRTLATELMTSAKNRWEHRITIDWLLDSLLPFCSYVDAEPEPSIVTLANVHHLGTRVEGRLSHPPASVLELVSALHPTPAVGGAPQADALALIEKLEQADRGRYAGPTGWVDAEGNGVFSVSVRSAQVQDNEVKLFAGVGVVDDSDPEAELAETRSKFDAMLGALLQP